MNTILKTLWFNCMHVVMSSGLMEGKEGPVPPKSLYFIPIPPKLHRVKFTSDPQYITYHTWHKIKEVNM